MDISGAEESDDDDGDLKSHQQSGAAVAAAKSNAMANCQQILCCLGVADHRCFLGWQLHPGSITYTNIKTFRCQTRSIQSPVFNCKDDDEVDWSYLQPLVAAVYAVIADGRDGVTNLMLVYAEQAYSDVDQYPLCLSFECTSESAASTILVYSDLTITSHAIDPAIRQASNSAQGNFKPHSVINPIAPSTPCSSRITTVQKGLVAARTALSGSHFVGHYMGGDKSKITFFTRGEADAKISGNAAILTRIRNQGKGTLRLMSLPVMQAPLLLVKLLTMTFCVTLDFIGTSVAMMSIFQEKYGDPNSHYSRIFLGIKDSLRPRYGNSALQHQHQLPSVEDRRNSGSVG
eukprot:gene36396-47381_t